LNWEGEIALDVEWAHAIAPAANLLLVEANSNSVSDMYTGVDYARRQPGVTVVSMSWVNPGSSFGFNPELKSLLQTPPGHVGVTFVASAGDAGANVYYPAISPNVLSVGGTKLVLDDQNNRQSETGWNRGGGGISLDQPLPAYQASTGYAMRTSPDVAYNADPATAVFVYDSYNNCPQTPWSSAAGTSAGAPQRAALIAIANQGRASIGLGSLDGANHTLPLIYQAPASSYYDVTVGSNGYHAGAGYDLVTGRGTPVVPQLMAALVPKQSPRTQSSSLIQSGFGLRGNLEMVAPLPAGGIGHYWRNNDAPNTPWSLGEVFGFTFGRFTSATLIESNFSSSGNGPGDLVVVARNGDRLDYFQKPDNSSQWISYGNIRVGPSAITGVSGSPALIQGRFGTKGNFEMVVPGAADGLTHFWLDNDAPGTPWHVGATFGQFLGRVDSVSLVESDYSASGHGPGNLELMARVGSYLAYFWRLDNSSQWQLAGYLERNGSMNLYPDSNTLAVGGDPTMIQSRFGGRGNFEMVVPDLYGGFDHFWRENDAPGTPWHSGGTFGQSLGHLDSVSLIQSNYTTGGGYGDLEVIARVGTRQVTFWRGDQAPFAWTRGADF
jgi:hypothetical protein